MRDKRPVDELSIEDLERVLAIRRREDRQKRLGRMRASGRVIETPKAQPKSPAASNAQSFASPASPAPTPPREDGIAIPAATITLDALDAILERRDAPPRFEEPMLVPSMAVAVAMTVTSPDYAAVALGSPLDAEPDEMAYVNPSGANKAGKRFVNAALLLVEIAAVAGLIVLGIGLFIEMGDLQRESREAQQLADAQLRASIPTLAPTSVIQVVRLEDFVLPGGHVIDSDGNASLNLGEFLDDVPSHLRDDVVRQALALDLTRPVATSETALQVFIPTLNIDAVITQGTDWEALKRGVGQVQNGATPSDETGNVALAAHNDIYGALFEDIPDLVIGDVIQVQTTTQTFSYRVTSTEIVEPDEVRVLEDQGRAMLTLITCYPPGVNNKRYIVHADREDNFELRS
jgi:LPXTG-site transpeptidase (sortase) family protein